MVEAEEEKYEEEAKMLHVSNASLNTTKKTEKGGKFKVYCQVGDKKFIIANLQEGSTENYALDLYFKQDEQVTFSLVGKGGATVHLTGYWETSALSMEDDYGMGPLEMDMDEEEDIDLDPATRHAIDQAKANAMKNALAGMHDDEEEEESEEEHEPLIQAKAPKTVTVTTKTVKVTAPAKKIEESDEEESEDDFQPVNAPAAAEDSDEESESEEAPGLVNAGANKKAAKQPVFEEEDSDEDSDEFDVKAILANKKRKAGDQPASNVDQKRQKVNEDKEKNVEKTQKQNPKQIPKQNPKQQHQKQNQNQNKQHQHQHKQHNKNQNQNQNKDGHKKRHNKHHNKNKGGRN